MALDTNGNGTPRIAQRQPQRRRIFTPGNRFDFDHSKIPSGMVYQWNRVTLAGQEDPENMILCEQNGWTPVPAERHPELSGLSASKGSAIVRGGLMLCQQPVEYAQEAQELDRFAARNVIESQIQRLGLQARKNGGRGIKREIAPLDREAIE